ncbi:hypothetical protein QW71_32885 [Paenibacillus sp. IHB B 3415]|nr:hypothetical protein QW71_32885 [Paenibacillus sp. IHB B 3415]
MECTRLLKQDFLAHRPQPEEYLEPPVVINDLAVAGNLVFATAELISSLQKTIKRPLSLLQSEV